MTWPISGTTQAGEGHQVEELEPAIAECALYRTQLDLKDHEDRPVRLDFVEYS